MPLTPVMLRKLQALFVGVEASEGVDPTLAGANALQLAEPATISPAAEQLNQRPDMHNQLLDEAAPAAPGGKSYEISGRLYVRGRGGAYSTSQASEPHALLAGAGFPGVFAAGAWTHDSVSVNQPSLTFYGFEGLDTNVWVKKVLTGAKLSRLAYVWEWGSVGFWEFTARGKYVAPADQSLLTPTYQTSIPPIIGASGAVAIGAYSTGKFPRGSIEIVNTLAARGDANSTDGLAGFTITSRRIIATLQGEGVRVADYDPLTKWSSNANEALQIRHNNAVAGNRLKVDADKATIMEPPPGQERDGFVDFRAQYLLSPEGSNRCKFTFD